MTRPDAIRLFSADLDGTLIGNPESTHRFKIAWASLRRETRPLLVYNSGRLVDDLSRFVDSGALPAGDYYIGGVGTQIFEVAGQRMLEELHGHLAAGWDLAKVREITAAFPGVRPQPDEFQHEFKSSWFLDRASPAAIRGLTQQFADAGLKVKVVYSSVRDLDVLPFHATKGGALEWLCARLAVPLGAVLVAGDTGNDASMFRLPGVRGIVVENALPELFEATVDIPTFSSRRILAEGVLDGLHHYGVIAAVPLAGKRRPVAPDGGFQQLFTGTKLGGLSASDRAFLGRAHAQALVALRKNITPLGFSACSLTDNTVSGTDANYRSVWARDGAFTVWSTLHLEDEEIRAAQTATLETLLHAASPNGQIPANVRIDDGSPDYSGVGNIASIDSGLWVLIALYNHANLTGDHSLLYRHADRLQTVMNWLGAHDSNNDGLLEIPEAGDWTDLFGRSYHVLYDEVLWFRATVCYGRILELMGKFEEAAGYLRHSQVIRRRLVDAFWPSTQAVRGSTVLPSGRAAWGTRNTSWPRSRLSPSTGAVIPTAIFSPS